MINTGDTVRFLNAVGGGVVKRIDAKKGLVYVEDADGFEVPVLEKECVIVPKVSATTNVPIKDFHTKNANMLTPQTQTATQKTAIFEEEETIFETPEGDKLVAFLAFVPLDIKQLQTTDYECYLINDSNYFLSYNLILGQNSEFRSAANGTIEPNTQQWLFDVKKTDLNDWEQAKVQILAFKKERNYTPQNVVEKQLQLDLTRFYKLHSFVENDYFDEPALMINLTEKEVKSPLLGVSTEEIKTAMQQKNTVNCIQKPRVQKKQIRKAPIIELDLHAADLLETTAGMSAADILNYQLEKFHEMLAQYRDKRGQRIVFIHGKGEGVLRKEIENQLKNRYKTYYFQDASFQQYGFGATLVMIR